jgi:hypothetical protein
LRIRVNFGLDRRRTGEHNTKLRRIDYRAFAPMRNSPLGPPQRPFASGDRSGCNLLRCNAAVTSTFRPIPTVDGNSCQSGGAMACLGVKAVERRGNRSDRPLLVSPPPPPTSQAPLAVYLLLLIPPPHILAGSMTDASQPSGTPLVSFITSHSTISEFMAESLLSDVPLTYVYSSWR